MTSRSLALLVVSAAAAHSLVIPGVSPRALHSHGQGHISHTFPLLRSSREVSMAEGGEGEKKLPFILDIGTKGGIVFYSIVGIVLPFIAYNFMLETLGFDVVCGLQTLANPRPSPTHPAYPSFAFARRVRKSGY